MRMKNKLIALIGISLTSLTVTSSIQAREFGDIYTQCGLGGAIFSNHAVMAAISNVTWDLGTTAVLSDISSPDSCTGTAVAAATFINESYATLEQDIAKGEGNHLSALMDIMDCSTTERSNVVDAIRSDFGSVVSAEGYSEFTQQQKSEELYNIIKSDKFSGTCGV